MPQKSKIIVIGSLAPAEKMPLAFATLQQLGWKISLATDTEIVAYTPRTWKRYDQEILIGIVDGELQISSKMIHGEAFDLGKINQKNIAAFENAFIGMQPEATEQNLQRWREEMAHISRATIQEAIEVQQTMNPSGTSPYLTYGILAINVLVFVLMVISGVNVLNPTGEDIFNWGGSWGPNTANGEYWRLLTCIFVHIGIMHLLFNSYALFIVGSYLEPLLGKARFLLLYLSTGIIASVVSVWWNIDNPPVSAGASGAIFGLNGVMLALLTTNLIPSSLRKNLLQAFGVLVGYNLLYGWSKEGIDNAAHMGGLVSGFAFGYLFYFLLLRKKDTAEKASVSQSYLAYGLVLLVTAAAIGFSQQERFRQQAVSPFQSTFATFMQLENEALSLMNTSDTSTVQGMAQQLTTVVLPNWNRAAEMWRDVPDSKLTDVQIKLKQLLIRYSILRTEQTNLFIKTYREDTDRYLDELNQKGQEIEAVTEEIKKLGVE